MDKRGRKNNTKGNIKKVDIIELKIWKEENNNMKTRVKGHLRKVPGKKKKVRVRGHLMKYKKKK